MFNNMGMLLSVRNNIYTDLTSTRNDDYSTLKSSESQLNTSVC